MNIVDRSSLGVALQSIIFGGVGRSVETSHGRVSWGSLAVALRFHQLSFKRWRRVRNFDTIQHVGALWLKDSSLVNHCLGEGGRVLWVMLRWYRWQRHRRTPRFCEHEEANGAVRLHGKERSITHGIYIFTLARNSRW